MCGLLSLYLFNSRLHKDFRILVAIDGHLDHMILAMPPICFSFHDAKTLMKAFKSTMDVIADTESSITSR